MSDNFLAGQNLVRLCRSRFEFTTKAFRTSVSDRVRQLLADGADPDFSYQGSNPLCEACRSGNLAIVKILLNHGSSVNIQNADGDTPLHLAASSTLNLPRSLEFKDVVHHLVQHGACINIKNNQGQSPLFLAVMNRDITIRTSGRYFPDTVKYLMQHGANVNIPYFGKPWIHYLLAKRDLEWANLVLQARMSPYYCGSIHIDTYSRPYRLHIFYGDYGLKYTPPHDVNVFWRSYLHQLSTAGFDISIESMELFDIRHLCVHSHPFLSHYEYLSETYSDVKMLEQFLPQGEKTIPRLYQACRTRIRHELAFSKAKGHIIRKIDSLVLPQKVKSYLKLEDTPSFNDQIADEYVVPNHKMCCYIL